MSQTHSAIDQKDSSGLTLAELNFCYQYCTFVKSQLDHQPNEKAVHQFLERYPLPTDIVYPKTWTTDPTESTQAADRFVELSRPLFPVKERTTTSSIFNMATFKNIAWFFAVGFAGNQLLGSLGVNAVPTAVATTDAPEVVDGMTFYPKGLYFDNVTQHEFELYHLDDLYDNATALKMYYDAYETETTLAKRDWYDCQFPPGSSYIRKFCCHTKNGLGGFVAGTGSAAAGGFINGLATKAFNGKRDNKNPRSVCITKNGKNACVSWATYDTDVATAKEEDAIARYSVECAESGGSSEFETETANGGLLYVCVSGRAKGCHADPKGFNGI